jgi:hypothetical protein
VLTWDLNHVADFRAAPSRPSISKLKVICRRCPSFTHYRGTKVFSGLWLLSHLSQTSDLSAQYYWQVQYSAHWLRVLHLLRHHVADLLSLSTAGMEQNKQHDTDFDAVCARKLHGPTLSSLRLELLGVAQR